MEEQFTLTHGSPRDPVWEYILRPGDAGENLAYFDTPFCLVGHTHVPVIHALERQRSTRVRSSSSAGRQADGAAEPARRAILNPGSVGQPRDNDPRAAYAIVDTEQLTWQARRVAYAIEITQAHMRAAGLPERLINRLAFGW